MNRRLGRGFFIRPATTVARELLGKFLVRRFRGRLLRGKIVETEAYIGPEDKASHAFGGKRTKRNQAEFMVGGHVYIYLVYGMHWQLNISTGREGRPECVLIRALDSVVLDLYSSIPRKTRIAKTEIRNLANGPGKLCRWLRLNKSFYGEDVSKSRRLWLEDRGVAVSAKEVVSGPRIGIDYAGPYWSKKPWRFYIKS